MDTEYLLYVVIGLIFLAILIITFMMTGSKSSSEKTGTQNLMEYTKVISLSPLGSSTDKLCDFYIASSAYSVFPSYTTGDYISEKMIPLVIKAGARLIELDIYDGCW